MIKLCAPLKSAAVRREDGAQLADQAGHAAGGQTECRGGGLEQPTQGGAVHLDRRRSTLLGLGWAKVRAAVESVMSSFCRRLAGKPAQLTTTAWASAMVWALVAAVGWRSAGTA